MWSQCMGKELSDETVRIVLEFAKGSDGKGSSAGGFVVGRLEDAGTCAA